MINRFSRKGGLSLSIGFVKLLIYCLITLLLVTGAVASYNTFSWLVTDSDAASLCDALSCAIADELRFAEDLRMENDTVVFSSRRYGKDVYFSDDEGRICVSRMGDPGTRYYLLADKVYKSLDAGLEGEVDGGSLGIGLDADVGTAEVTVFVTKNGKTVRTNVFTVSVLSMN